MYTNPNILYGAIMNYRSIASLLIFVACVLSGCGLHSESHILGIALENEQDAQLLAIEISCWDSQNHIGRKDDCSGLAADWKVTFIDEEWSSGSFQEAQEEANFIEEHTIIVQEGVYKTGWKNQQDALGTFRVEIDEMSSDFAQSALIQVTTSTAVDPQDILVTFSRDEETGEISSVSYHDYRKGFNTP